MVYWSILDLRAYHSSMLTLRSQLLPCLPFPTLETDEFGAVLLQHQSGVEERGREVKEQDSQWRETPAGWPT